MSVVLMSLALVALTTFALLVIERRELRRRLKEARTQLHVEQEAAQRALTQVEETRTLLQDMTAQRADERKGRIRLQQKLREQEQQRHLQDGYQFKPIGVVRSPFADRRGTPRQPQLVPDGKASIQFAKSLNADYWTDLQGFSHIWVLFVFHENTNVGSESVKAKAQPPRLGKKVSVFSTRSPHRPNPIGLSVVEIAGIDSRCIHIRSGDFVDGTPVLDIKPYIPYDIVAGHRVPDWVQEQVIEQKPVNFHADCREAVQRAVEQRELRFYEDADEFLRFVEQILRQDIRGVHQGRGAETTTPYMCRLDNAEFSFTVSVESIHVNSCRIVHHGKSRAEDGADDENNRAEKQAVAEDDRLEAAAEWKQEELSGCGS